MQGDYDPNRLGLEFWTYNSTTGYKNREYFWVEGVMCTLDHFHESLAEELTALNISSYIWPSTSDIKLIGTFESQKFDFLTFFINDPGSGFIQDSSVQFLYVEAVYDETNHEDPIKYLINTDVIMRFDPYDYSYYDFRIRPNVVKFLNGTERVFFDMRFMYYSYYYMDETYVSNVYLLIDDEYEVYTQYLYFQPELDTETVGGRRALNSTSTHTKDESKPPIIYEVFYIISSLGGIYTFCLFVIGLVLRPIIDKMFAHETVNTVHEVNKNTIMLLKNEEIRFEENYKQLQASKAKAHQPGLKTDVQGLNQSIQEDEPFLLNEEVKEGEKISAKLSNAKPNPHFKNKGK